MSLVQLMIDHGFTLPEFELLNRSLSLSNEFVTMETKTMNAVEGKYEDSSGEYTIQGKPNLESAKDLVCGNEYMSTKAKIMEPMEEFLEHIDGRTSNIFGKFNQAMNVIMSAALILSIVTAALMVDSIV